MPGKHFNLYPVIAEMSYKGMNTRQIAEELGIKTSAVKTILYRQGIKGNVPVGGPRKSAEPTVRPRDRGLPDPFRRKHE